MSTTAFTSIVTMHQAAWGDEAGSTVTFKLPMAKTGDSRNPFHSFTKRRKGSAGTRFRMSVSTCEDKPQPVYLDEAMLAGWNDSQQNGHTVKFWLCNDAMGHPFEGYSRKQEFALVLEELDDDNESIDQKMRERVEQQGTKSSERLSYAAAMLCKSEAFWEWASQDDTMVLAQRPISMEADAISWLYEALSISSRAELDSDPVIAQMFEQKIRKPFLLALGSC